MHTIDTPKYTSTVPAFRFARKRMCLTLQSLLSVLLEMSLFDFCLGSVGSDQGSVL